MSHNVNMFPSSAGWCRYRSTSSVLSVCVCHEGLSSALTGTGGNFSETGAKARFQSPADAHVPEPAVPRVDTGPSEAEAPLERGNKRKRKC